MLNKPWVHQLKDNNACIGPKWQFPRRCLANGSIYPYGESLVYLQSSAQSTICLLWWDLLDYTSLIAFMLSSGSSLQGGVQRLCFVTFGPTVWEILNSKVFMDQKIRKLLLLLFHYTLVYCDNGTWHNLLVVFDEERFQSCFV